MGCLDPVPDHMRQGCLDHLPGMIRLLPRPVPEGRAETVRHGRDPVLLEQSLLTRAGKVLAAWGGKDSRDEDSPDTLRKAIAEGDWETIEQHGGLNEVMSKTGKRAEGGRIDGFTLWWPELCRQIGAHSTKGTWCAEVVRALSLSPRGGALRLLWPAFPPRCPNPHR